MTSKEKFNNFKKHTRRIRQII